MDFQKEKEEDLKEMVRLVGEAWDYSKYGYNSHIREAQAKRDLLDCLSKSNYCELAFKEGKLAGFLIGRLESEPLRPDYKELRRLSRRITFDFLFVPEGRLLYGYSDLFNRSNSKLFREAGKDYDAEIILFVVSKAFRGQGVGKALLKRFEEWVKENGAESLYLFSDSACDYPFYLRQGFRKAGQTQGRSEFRNNELMDFFLLEIDL